MTTLQDWAGQGRFETVFGHRVFVVEAGAADAPALLILHGFPSSSLDYRHALGRLADRFRVVVHDMLGFGLTDKPMDHAYSLFEQADLAIGLWRDLGIRRGHLLAHDYGTSVATEILARRERDLCPVGLDSLTLCNGSMHIELAAITLSQKLLKHRRWGPLMARLSSQRFFTSRIRAILGRPDAVDDEELRLMWRALVHGDGRATLPVVARYLEERQRFWHRWIGPLTRLDIPAHVVWGRLDPIAVPAIAEQLGREIPGATLTWLDDLGHYPMIEDPGQWADAVLRFLG